MSELQTEPQSTDNLRASEPQTVPQTKPSEPAPPASLLGVGSFTKQPDGIRIMTNVRTLDTVTMEPDGIIEFKDGQGNTFGGVAPDGTAAFKAASGNIYVVGLNDHSIGYIDDDGTIVKLSSDAPEIAKDASMGETVTMESGRTVFKDAAGKVFGAMQTTPGGTGVGWVQPDNGDYILGPDRTVAIFTPEGGSFIVAPDNTRTEQSSTGYTSTDYPDGTYSLEDPETRKTITYGSDGQVIGEVKKDEFGNIIATPGHGNTRK